MNRADREQVDTDSPPRGMLHLLGDRRLGPFIAAMLMSTSGVWIHNVVAAILVYELSASSFLVGLVSVAQFGPQLLLAPWSGARADRGDRVLQILIGRALVALGSGTLGVWVLLVGVDGLPGAWPVVATAGIVGIGFVVIAPAQHALVPQLVPRRELASAIALSAVPPTLGRAGGPALGAVVAVTLGPGIAFLIAAAGNLLGGLTVLVLKIGARRAARASTKQRLLDGFRYLVTDRTLIRLLIGIAAIGVGADPIITLTPSLVAQLGENPAFVGVLVSSFGTGAALTFAILSPLRRRLGLPLLASLGLLLLALGNALAGLSPASWIAVVSLGVAGAGMTFSFTGLNTLLQERLPDAVRGRITALWSIAFIGSRPIAAAVNGAVSDATAPVVAFLGVALAVSVAAYICRGTMLAPVPRTALAQQGPSPYVGPGVADTSTMDAASSSSSDGSTVRKSRTARPS